MSDRSEAEPGATDLPPLPHPSRCRVQYSQFLQQYLCLVRKPDECPYVAIFAGQTYCCHPQAAEIARVTWKG